jgi:hypothetical protein
VAEETEEGDRMLRRLWVKAQASSGTAGKVVEVARAG